MMLRKYTTLFILLVCLLCSSFLLGCNNSQEDNGSQVSVYVRYSKNADGTDFKTKREEGYDYIGVAAGETAPTDKTKYTWISIKSDNNQVEVEEGRIFIKYSASSDGTAYTDALQEDTAYIGVAIAEEEPRGKDKYVWTSIKIDTEKDEPQVSDKTSIKVLAIGNSFSEDATRFLWHILKDAGYQNVIVANMYIGGCSLDTHWNKILTLGKYEEYQKNTNGTINRTANSVSLGQALTEEAWDVITLQQSSGVSGIPSSYGNLKNIIDYINKVKLNPNAKLYWHMTWAYESDINKYQHPDFPKYNSNQMDMYNAIVDTTQKCILPLDAFDGVIPSGTAVQNLRTSVLGSDGVTRDNYHLSLDFGRYLAGLTWLETITDCSVDDIDYLPTTSDISDPTTISKKMTMLKESVKNAIKSPFSVTRTTSMPDNQYEQLTATDISLLSGAGYIASNYKKVKLEWHIAAYYNPISQAEMFADGSNWCQKFACTNKFARHSLPNGSLIFLSAGYQYRPDGFYRTSITLSRPEVVTSSLVVVNDAWWGEWDYRAFNLAYLNPSDGSATPETPDMTASDCNAFTIYIPIDAI